MPDSNLSNAQDLDQSIKTSRSLAILMIVLGVLAIIYPLFATIFTFNVIGFVLLLFGFLQLFHGFLLSKAKPGQHLLTSLIGIFYLMVGFWILRHPVFSILDLTLVIGILFFIQGAVQVIHAFEGREEHRKWPLVNGIAGIILGILIWSRWPLDSLSLLGLLVGINLILSGVSIVKTFRAEQPSLASRSEAMKGS
jgi:uncharacterized membrane protein HdeD (DUF308 family)